MTGVAEAYKVEGGKKHGIIAPRNESLTYFLLKDHLGSTRVLMNENNQAISSYDYDA